MSWRAKGREEVYMVWVISRYGAGRRAWEDRWGDMDFDFDVMAARDVG